MLDKTITAALLALRTQIIRDGLDGLPHVEALLIARGVDLPRVAQKIRQRKDTSRLALQALGDGPKRPVEIAARMAELSDLTPQDAWRRVYQALHNLRRRGFVEKDGALWRAVRLHDARGRG